MICLVGLHLLMYKKNEHNPIKLLSLVSNERLEELSKDKGFLNQLEKVYASLQNT